MSSITDDGKQRDFLLSYIDIPIYSAVSSALNTTTSSYTTVKDFLIKRYSTIDTYLERIEFFTTQFSLPAENFASKLNQYIDRFDSDFTKFKEELLVAKFLSSVPSDYEKELRLRRPTTLSQCVEICNSLSNNTVQYPVSAVNKPPTLRSRSQFHDKKTGIICYRCGSENHVASFPGCPAKNSTCHNCNKKGHFKTVCKGNEKPATRVSTVLSKNVSSVSRPCISLLLENSLCVDVIVDTGSEISVLSLRECKRCNIQVLSDVPLSSFSNFDQSPLRMCGKTKPMSVIFNNKQAVFSFYVADVLRVVQTINHWSWYLFS